MGFGNKMNKILEKFLFGFIITLIPILLIALLIVIMSLLMQAISNPTTLNSLKAILMICVLGGIVAVIKIENSF